MSLSGEIEQAYREFLEDIFHYDFPEPDAEAGFAIRGEYAGQFFQPLSPEAFREAGYFEKFHIGERSFYVLTPKGEKALPDSGRQEETLSDLEEPVPERVVQSNAPTEAKFEFLADLLENYSLQPDRAAELYQMFADQSTELLEDIPYAKRDGYATKARMAAELSDNFEMFEPGEEDVSLIQEAVRETREAYEKARH